LVKNATRGGDGEKGKKEKSFGSRSQVEGSLKSTNPKGVRFLRWI